MSDKLKIKIKPLAFMDLLAFKNLIPKRKKMFENASAACPEAKPVVNELARRLHPIRQYMTIEEVVDETPDVRSFKLKADPARQTSELAIFRAGQYLSVKLNVGDEHITRPYSIASSPEESQKGYYRLTIKRAAFATDYLWENWKAGIKVETSGPEGQFYYTRLRDMPHIVGIAGGSGITPFLSMMSDFEDKGWPVDFTLFYGCNCAGDIVCRKQIDKLEKNSRGKFKVVYIMAKEEPEENMEKGFITAELIKKYVQPELCSFFICGPQAMYTFINKELDQFSLPIKQMRYEVFGEAKNVAAMEGYPQNVPDSFTIETIYRGEKKKIPAFSRESVLVAMERAGFAPPSKCRSGQCGFCRTRLISGDVYVPSSSDDRRSADKKFRIIHACSSYPLSDLTIEVPHDEV
jgi:ferredoxin-NADP reductase